MNDIKSNNEGFVQILKKTLQVCAVKSGEIAGIFYQKYSASGFGEFLVICIGGIMGAATSSMQDRLTPSIFVYGDLRIDLVTGAMAAVIGNTLIAGTDPMKLMRRFALSLLCGFASAAVIASALEHAGLADKEKQQTAQQAESELKKLYNPLIAEMDEKMSTSSINDVNDSTIPDLKSEAISLLAIVSQLQDRELSHAAYHPLVRTIYALQITGTSGRATAAIEALKSIQAYIGDNGSKPLNDYLAAQIKIVEDYYKTALKTSDQPVVQEGNTVEGWVRFANKPFGKGWEDFLFNSPGGAEDNVRFSDKLMEQKSVTKPNPEIKATTAVFFRPKAPDKTSRGIIPAPDNGAVPKDQTVTVLEYQYLTTNSGNLSQLWFKVSVPKSALQGYVEE